MSHPPTTVEALHADNVTRATAAGEDAATFRSLADECRSTQARVGFRDPAYDILATVAAHYEQMAGALEDLRETFLRYAQASAA